MSLLEAALGYAARGIPVFPCLPGGKEPATPHGFKDATTDADVIRRWWSNDEYNIAFCPHVVGLSVIDLDGGWAGQEEWDALGEAPPTWTVATPRGGRHLYFKGAAIPTQKILAPHIDTRGIGSYALLPPSTIGGKSYTVIDSRPPAPLPLWVQDLLINYDRKRRERRQAAAVEDLDQPGNVERVRKFLEDAARRGDVAIEFHGGNHRTYVLACDIMNLGISESLALDLIRDLWNPACLPPWSADELQEIVGNAARYAENEAGAWAAAPASEVFGEALDQLPHHLLTPAPPTRAGKFRPLTLEEIARMPPPEFLIPEMIPAKGVSVFYGQMGSFKSFLLLQLALDLAKAGRTVVYAAGEGARGLEMRSRAWRAMREHDGPLPIYLVPAVPWANDGAQIVDFIEEMKGAQISPDLVVMDTVARMSVGLDENSAKDMGTLVAALDTIRVALGCAVAGIHHTGKDDARGMRGSNVLPAASDAAFEIKAHKPTKAVEIRCVRQKDAQERETPWTYEGYDLAGSLAFREIPLKDYHRLIAQDDDLDRRKVGAALKTLGAAGSEAGITTAVLASQLCPQGPEDDHEVLEQRRASFAKALTQRARGDGKLAAYCEGDGAARRWFLPDGVIRPAASRPSGP